VNNLLKAQRPYIVICSSSIQSTLSVFFNSNFILIALLLFVIVTLLLHLCSRPRSQVMYSGRDYPTGCK